MGVVDVKRTENDRRSADGANLGAKGLAGGKARVADRDLRISRAVEQRVVRFESYINIVTTTTSNT